MAFEDNIYYGHTLEPQLAQVEDLLGRLPETALVDRGCKGRKSILGVNIKIPGSGKGKTAYQKAKDREVPKESVNRTNNRTFKTRSPIAQKLP